MVCPCAPCGPRPASCTTLPSGGPGPTSSGAASSACSSSATSPTSSRGAVPTRRRSRRRTGSATASSHVPPTIVLGEDGADSPFDLICWNAAHSLVEGVRRPYRAARPVVDAAYFRPADTYGLGRPLTALCERYVDAPDERPAVADEIIAVLTRFLDVAPWPR